MLIVRFAMPASCRVRWNSAIAFAVIAESGTSPKCFLTRLSRSSSSSIVRGEHRIRLAVQVGVDRIREPLRPLFVGGQPAVSSFFDRARVLGASPLAGSSCRAASGNDGRRR